MEHVDAANTTLFPVCPAMPDLALPSRFLIRPQLLTCTHPLPAGRDIC